LKYVVKKSLEGHESEVKEFTIASEVFGRKEDYDPRIDSLVRVQAARLRAKLEEYYESEGKEDRVYISLPKGHYVPTFSYDRPEKKAVGRSASIIPARALEKLKSPVPFLPQWLQLSSPFWVFLLLIFTVGFGFISYYYYSELKKISNDVDTRRQEPLITPSMHSFWKDFIDPASPVLVAYSNPVFEGNAVDGLRYSLPFDSDPSSLRPSAGYRGAKSQALIDVYTGVGEVKAVVYLSNLFWRLGRSFRVERSLLLNWEDLKTQNIVFLGGPAENVHLRRIPQEQDFVHDKCEQHPKDPCPRFRVFNRKPKPGESRYYEAVIEGPSQSLVTKDYGLISMLRGLEPNRRLLILAGVTTFGTQACAEFVTKPELIQQLTERMNISKNPSHPELPPYFQVLIEIKIEGSVPVKATYVTHHVLN
jgi:hypothetical protein